MSADMPPKRLLGTKYNAMGRRDTKNTLAVSIEEQDGPMSPSDGYTVAGRNGLAPSWCIPQLNGIDSDVHLLLQALT